MTKLAAILKPVGDAPLLPPSPAGEWPLALPPGATWTSLERAVRALLESRASWLPATPLYLYVGSAASPHTPFLPLPEQLVGDLLEAFGLRTNAAAPPVSPPLAAAAAALPRLVLSYARAPAW